MATVWAAMAGLGGYLAWYGPTYTILRLSAFNRVLGVLVLAYGLGQLVRTLWMLAQRGPAIEFFPDCLVVRGAGPPARQIPWDEIESVSGVVNRVTVRYGQRRRLTVNSMILEGPYAADGRRVAARMNQERSSR